MSYDEEGEVYGGFKMDDGDGDEEPMEMPPEEMIDTEEDPENRYT
ncbi:MAG: hypothetical protein AAB809_02020 [Patescibacteria group bacterium]